MPELSIEHIERIAREVKKQEIIFSHLADELIDHICCDVEYEMQDGLTFYEAYRKSKAENLGIPGVLKKSRKRHFMQLTLNTDI